jgi:asparagine synthase (glutamine-hydrolysing)
MALAHGVEGRFPFLDHRLFEFAAALPTGSKLRGLREKAIVRRWARGVLPDAVSRRPKHAYRAPDAPAFHTAPRCDYLDEVLSASALRDAGVFAPEAVAALLRRCRAGQARGLGENQAFVAVLSTQLWHHCFMKEGRAAPAALRSRPDVALTEALAP